MMRSRRTIYGSLLTAQMMTSIKCSGMNNPSVSSSKYLSLKTIKSQSGQNRPLTQGMRAMYMLFALMMKRGNETLMH